MMSDSQFPILLVEDNKHDVRFVQRAWEENRILNLLDVVPNGQVCMQYLRQEGHYANKHRPGIILMDIRMPVMSGIETLEHIRADPELKKIPVIMLTTSREDSDLTESYKLGCNSFIQKPSDYEHLIDVIQIIHRYWTLSTLPPD